MKKNCEKELQLLEMLCVVIALAACIPGILFLFDIVQTYWCLNVTFILGILLHAALALLLLVRRKNVYAGISALLMLFYAGALVYFNFL